MSVKRDTMLTRGIIMDKDKKLLYAMNACYFIYFLLLIIERLTSVTLSIVSGFPVFGDGFHATVYVVIPVSILGFLVYMGFRGRDFVRFLFSPNKIYPENLKWTRLVFASCLLLFSGMVHSEYTISGLQFASYGFFIAGILFQVIRMVPRVPNKGVLWLSFAYLVSFSMAIPVAYFSRIEASTAFHILEFIAVLLLVTGFFMMTMNLYEGRSDLFSYIYIVVAIAMDVPLIVMRWNEEVNVFVLIFISLSTLLFIAGKVVTLTLNHRKKSENS